VVIDWISKALSSCDVSSSVLSTAESKESFVDATGTRVVNCKSWGELFSLPISPSLVVNFLKVANKYDVVCLHYPFPIADLAVALLWKRKCALIVYWHSEIVSQKFTSYIVRPFTRILLHRADRIVCSSPLLLEYSNLLRQHRSKCEVIPFGKPSDDQKVSITHRPSESDYLLFVGRHVPYKGISVLLSAFADYKRDSSSSDLILKLVGNGPLLEKHRTQAKELDIENHVDFIYSADDEMVGSLIKQCRCFVLPSIMPSEAFALVQLESMHHGRPIINTRLKSGVPWVARDEFEAITVTPNSVAELAAAISTVASENELIDTLGDNGKARANSVFDFQLFSDRTLALYESLASPQAKTNGQSK